MNDVTIERLVDVEARAAPADIVAGIDRIFWATAAKRPDDLQAARAFRQLWLGQYLEHERDLVFVALADGAADVRATAETVVGYVAGCRIDPARSERFAALNYFQSFAALTQQFRAHLHVNVDAGWRGCHVGERLVERLCADLAREGVRGIHIVTGRDQRNVGFYRRLGFSEMARAPRGATEVVFMGRGLAGGEKDEGLRPSTPPKA